MNMCNFKTPCNTDPGLEENYFHEAFSRNIGLLTEAEQRRLRSSRVAIPGLGGVGGDHLISLVRSGVGKFNIADMDHFEVVNINRQYGADQDSFNRPKLDVMKEHALSINPFVEINSFPEGVTESNIDAFLENVDVVLDGLDFFALKIRRLLFARAREKGIFVVTAAPLGFSSALLIFSPHEGMSFDDYFAIDDTMAQEDKYLAFAMGLAPRPTHMHYMDLKKVSLKAKSGPSLKVSCLICAGIGCTKTIQIILDKGKIVSAPHYIQFDPYLMKLRKGHLLKGNRNLLQRFKSAFIKRILKKNQTEPCPKVCAIPKAANTEQIITDEIFNFLLKAGIQAPSGDNVQPWKFSTAKNTIHLHLDRSADGSFFNVEQFASIISCGAVIENICIAAININITTDVSYFPNGLENDLVASLALSFKKVPLPKDPLIHSIWQRNTNRKGYSQKNIPEHILTTIKNSIHDFNTSKLSLITEEEKIKEVAELVYAVDQIRCQKRSLHEFLHNMIRYSTKEATLLRNGFPIKNLEAGRTGEIFLRLTAPWKITKILNLMGFDKVVASQLRGRVLQSAGIGLLSVDEITLSSFLQGGRAFERVWLNFTHHGIELQPITPVTLFRLRWLLKTKTQFSVAHQKILIKIWKNLQQLFPEVDWDNHGPVMLFRFGYSGPISTPTLRKDISKFIK